MNILLVEDNFADVRLLERALAGVAGFVHTLDWVDDLPEAIEKTRNAPFDVMLLDLGLPTTMGLETCAAALAEISTLPIVVLTGATDQLLALQALRAGAQDYLVKGAFPGSAIVRVLQHAVERFASLRRERQRDEEIRLLLERVPAIVWTTDDQLRFTSLHGGTMQRLGLESADVLGRLVHEFFADDPAVGETFQRKHRDALLGAAHAFDINWRRWTFETQIAPIRGTSDSVTGTIGVAIDVTSHRRERAELQAARAVQHALLPRSAPRIVGYDIAGAAFPAEHTCGDWFDFVPRDDGSHVLVVGDVSGHGLAAAMLASNCSAVLSAMVRQHRQLADVLDIANRSYCARTRSEDFGIVQLAALAANSAEVRLAAAGDRIYVLDETGHTKACLVASGIPLWLVSESEYLPDHVVRLDPGDILVLLTDGFREARSPNGEMFGMARIWAEIGRRSHESAAEILHGLHRTVRDFTGNTPQQDDMTGVIVKRLPPES